MSVDSHEELMAWRQRLLDHGVHVTPVVDHGGVWFSIYFPDPNDVLLELTYQARDLTERRRQAKPRRWSASGRRRTASGWRCTDETA